MKEYNNNHENNDDDNNNNNNNNGGMGVKKDLDPQIVGLKHLFSFFQLGF